MDVLNRRPSTGGRTVIDEVKARLDIVDLIGSRVELRRAGQRFKGLCPFHQEKTPSFVVFPDRQSYHCFGCGKSGDVIRFVEETESLPFIEALKQLAERAGVQFEQPKPRPPEEDAAERRLREINNLCARFYNHLLLTSPQAAQAREYLEGRGLARAAWETWLLGWVPDGWDATLTFLKGRGYSAEEILAAGVVVERTGGGFYDRFRRRVIFPIRDAQGAVIAFGGRAMGDDKPKYLNSPESPLFRKGEHLYGLDLAGEAIKAEKRMVVVEGYADAVAAHAWGFGNVVATLGTALTPAHVRVLSRLTKRVVLALDADAAGDTAAMRGWEVIRDSSRRRRAAIRAKGRVVASSGESELEVRIARLPRGEDPDTLIRKSPETWRELIEGARTVVDHFFAVVEESADLRTPEGRKRALAELAPVVADLDNPVEQGHYVLQLARLVGIAEPEAHAEVRRARRTGGVKQDAPTYTAITTVSPEELALALLLRYPRLLADVPEEFAWGLERSEHREILERMRAHEPEDLTPDVLLAEVEFPLKEQVVGLMGLVAQQPELLLSEQREEFRRKMQSIRVRRLRDQINQHSLLLGEARELGDEAGVRALLEVVPSLAGEVREFDPPKSPYFKDSRER